jgi:hypothetical protein
MRNARKIVCERVGNDAGFPETEITGYKTVLFTAKIGENRGEMW